MLKGLSRLKGLPDGQVQSALDQVDEHAVDVGGLGRVELHERDDVRGAVEDAGGGVDVDARVDGAGGDPAGDLVAYPVQRPALEVQPARPDLVTDGGAPV